MERVRGMQAAAAPIEQFVSSRTELPQARLSAGTATAHFLADKFSALSLIGDEFRPNYVTTEAVLDIAHREVQLGIRNRPADSGNLTSRKLGLLRFAPYRSWSVPRPELLEWVAMDPDYARHPAARWLHEAELPVRAFASAGATVIERIVNIYDENAALLTGERPLRA